MAVNDEWRVMTYFKVLLQHLSGITEENCVKLFRPKFEPGKR
jgi:hypothetical protein